MKNNLKVKKLILTLFLFVSLFSWSQAVFEVKAPSLAKGFYQFGKGDSTNSSWGNGVLAKKSVVGSFVIASGADSLAGNALAGNYQGKILVLHRGGGFDFQVKTLNAQNAGAIAVVIINHGIQTDGSIDSSAYFDLNATSNAALNIKIPVILIGLKDGITLKNAIRKEGSVNGYIGGKLKYTDDLSFQDILKPDGVLPKRLVNFQNLYAQVRNTGKAAQKKIRLAIKLETNNTVSYLDTLRLDFLDTNVVNMFNFNLNVGKFAPGYYKLTYTVGAEQEDYYPLDNTFTTNFWITDSLLYSKGGYTKSFQALNEKYGFGSLNTQNMSWCIQIPSDNLIYNDLYIKSITTTLAASTNASLIGKTVNAQIYEWQYDFSNKKLVGEGSYTFQTNSGTNVTIPLVKGIPMLNGTRYFACINKKAQADVWLGLNSPVTDQSVFLGSFLSIDSSNSTLSSFPTLTVNLKDCKCNLNSTEVKLADYNEVKNKPIVTFKLPVDCQPNINQIAGADWLSYTTNLKKDSVTLEITASINEQKNERLAQFTINGNTFTVRQPGTGCQYQLSDSIYLCKNEQAATYTISKVSTSNSCLWTKWTATTYDAWINTSSTGTGSGSVVITVEENTSDCPRFGSIYVYDKVITIEQPGKNNNLGCAYSKSNWVLQNAKLQNESNPILTIKPTSQTNVWAPVKGSNLYVRTEDGGNTWENGAVTGATEYQFASFFALNKDTAWAPMFFKTGSKGDLFYTVNGGKTWNKSDTTLFKNASSFPDFMHFFDKQNGVVIGDPVNNQHEIFITKDAGKTWVRTNSPQSVDEEYPIINRYSTYKNNIWFVTTKGRVFKSSDKGVNWESYDIDKINLTSFLDNINIKFRDSLVGFFQFNSNSNSNYKTTDGGKTWMKVNNFISQNSLTDGDNLVYVPGNKEEEGRWICSNYNFKGTFYSVNDGKDWVSFDTLTRLTTLGFFDITHGWSATYNSYNSKYPKMYALNACAPKAPVSYSLMSDTTKLFYFSDSYKPCSKQEFALFAKGKGVIRWYDQSIGGNLLSSEASIQKQDIPFQSGKSTIYVQDSTCYVSARSSLTIVQNDDVNCVANINSALFGNLKIYPNPTSGNFTISNAPIGTYTIVDELGKVVHQFDVKEAEDQKVQALQLSKGIYFLRGSNAHFAQEKIVVIE